MRYRTFLSLLLGLILSLRLSAGEGMWIPSLLKQLNEAEMIEMGFRLSAEDIYSINHASMKDAVVLFGRGCTGEIISEEGLILTNHHCGLGQIQKHSSLEADYLTNGFWAMNKAEELPNPGLSVTLLKYMEDVTGRVLRDIPEDADEASRAKMVKENISGIIEEATKDNHYEAYIRPFYYGNVYYLFVNEVFKDVRLVGAPPSSIGKFGGDTDNWMWPRHTGDFSLFRIYAGPDNMPAEYAEDNVPYKPAYHFPISLNGYKKGDFTLVFGYPGSTDQFFTADAVKVVTEVRNPIAIDARRLRLDIFEKHMRQDEQVRIQYTAKHAGLANGWKKWIGENRGIRRLNTIAIKENSEKDFHFWTQSNDQLKARYGNLLPDFKKVYQSYGPATRAATYIREAGLAGELLRQAGQLDDLIGIASDKESDMALVKEEAEKALSRFNSFEKDFNAATDQDVLGSLLAYYYDGMNSDFIPASLQKGIKKQKGDFNVLAQELMKGSILSKPDAFREVLQSDNRNKIKKLAKDPLFVLADELLTYYYEDVVPVLRRDNRSLDSLYRVYVEALMQMRPDKRFYPDANLTLRVTYGQVDDYFPQDAVTYNHFTTLEGIMEKEALEVYDYVVPEKLRTLYEAGDYGTYAGADGKMHTCFIASNHTTGGNSGSPVLNADGQLIGINFDRNWEGTMSDIDYDPDMCRNISLDIRYCLFIIDKFAGAGHLIEEMSLVR